MQFFKFFGTYMELIQTGGFQCKAESDNLLIDVHGNVAGDILVFIGPNGKTSSAGTDIMELIRSDTKLENHWKALSQSLKYKFIGLAAIPKIMAWLFNALILYMLYSRLPFDNILTVTVGKNILSELVYRLPLLLPLLTLVFGKTIGISLLKPLLFVITRVVKLARMISRRKVA
jgi:hypothetical protein